MVWLAAMVAHGDQSRPAVFLTVKGQQATATQAGFDDICRRSGIVRR
jgi:hypothetical protein